MEIGAVPAPAAVRSTDDVTPPVDRPATDPSEQQTERHLHEAGAADGILNDPERGLRSDALDGRYAALHGVQAQVVVRHIKAGSVGEVKGIRLEAEREALADAGGFDDRKIQPLLERAAEQVARSIAEDGFRVIAKLGAGG